MATDCEVPPSINNNTDYENPVNEHHSVDMPVSSNHEEDGDVSPAQSGSEATTAESQSPQPPDSLPRVSSPTKGDGWYFYCRL